MRLEDKVCIITGAGQGIGKAIACLLAAEGASIAANDTNEETLQRLVGEIEGTGGKAIALPADVSRRQEVQRCVEAAVAAFGRVDILVNNAGVLRTALLHEISQDDWNLVMDVDLKGTFNCMQAVAPYMMQNRYGKIINISSAAATGVSGFGPAAYAAAKGGVIPLTKVAARELGPYGVNVNVVAPGMILTDIYLTQMSEEERETLIEERKKYSVLGRIGSPDDVAKLVLFLASDDASFITGQLICVDGGRCDRM